VTVVTAGGREHALRLSRNAEEERKGFSCLVGAAGALKAAGASGGDIIGLGRLPASAAGALSKTLEDLPWRSRLLQLPA